MSNGFFQVGCTPSGTIVKIVKPTADGEAVTAKEICEYLSNSSIMYDAGAVAQGVELLGASEKNDHLVMVNRDQNAELRESYVLKASPDKLVLSARFYPPSLKGSRITADEFLKDLQYKGVKEGIKEDVIKAWFEKPTYCTDVVVAEGTPVKQGQNAKIEYYFETDLSAKPKQNEDGSVDFFHLNTFTQCKAGDVLARLIPEVKGTPGVTVFGEAIKPAEVKRKVLKYGRNIAISEDNMTITSEVNGHVSLVEEKVFVSNVMELDNVGPATGNIDYDGNVLVLGNVNENYEVKANGDVEIRGVVEGATVKAGGSITIARGMKGMGKGTLDAGENIVAKFIENAEAQAKGYIEAEQIIHSNIAAGTEILAVGKKGSISGGKATAKNKVIVKTLGSEMGSDTVIEVGADPNVKKRLAEIQKRLQENMKFLEQSKPTIESFMEKMKNGAKLSLDQKMYMQTMVKEQKERMVENQELQSDYDCIQDILAATSDSSVEVSGEVYAGTKICISDVSMVVKNTLTYCRFKKTNGDVKMSAL